MICEVCCSKCNRLGIVAECDACGKMFCEQCATDECCGDEDDEDKAEDEK